jgi:hypothetical protein
MVPELLATLSYSRISGLMLKAKMNTREAKRTQLAHAPLIYTPGGIYGALRLRMWLDSSEVMY